MVQLEVEKVKYTKSQIENLDANDVISRLEKIMQTQKAFLAIAYDVGFNSPSAFYKAFQKLVGMTPTQFRQKNS